MPKNTNAAGPTYAGHEDTAPHKSQPEWAEVGGENADADPLGVFAGDLDDEVSVEPKKRGRPVGSKNKPKTVAGAQSAEGKGASRG